MNSVIQDMRPGMYSDDPAAIRAALRQHGAVLLRRSSRTLDDFIGLSDTLMTPMVHHATNTIERDAVVGDPRTSTVNKGMDEIPLHREGSYAPACPDLLMLYCQRPASRGGQTITCDGLRLFAKLPADIREFVAKLDIYWSWAAPEERWSQTLGTKDREEAEVRLAQIQAILKPWESLETRFERETLHGCFKTRCAIPCPDEDRLAFCNSLMIYYYRAPSEYYARDLFRPSLGDGTDFPAGILSRITDVARAESRQVSWEKGDVLIIDNARVMHGRRGFDDPDRRVLIRMGHVPNRHD